MSGSRDHNLSDMKNTIVYFTGTGNSLAVARLLAARLPHPTIISVNEMLRRSLFTLRTDTCAFVFPVYCQNAPEIVQRLVRQIEFPANAHIFAIATHNGDPGYSHFTLDKILRKKGQRLRSGFAVLMPGNSINPYNMNSDVEIQQRLKESAACVDKVADDIVKKKQFPYSGSVSLRKKLKGLRNMFRYKFVLKVSKRFWATDACNLCGLCVRICPENNIRIVSNQPEWGKKCQICFTCIHWCPQHAIQNGQNTVNRKRYHHPDISINDMLCRE
jgi:ferredoxin